MLEDNTEFNEFIDNDPLEWREKENQLSLIYLSILHNLYIELVF